MKIVVQNVKEASLYIDEQLHAKISKGYLLLVSFREGDNGDVIPQMVDKLVNMRVFPDENGKTNLAIKDINGEILSVSQFTLYASIKEGRRPSFTNCLKQEQAKALYNEFNKVLSERISELKTGVFGQEMEIRLVNQGPFTMILDSEELIK